MKDALTPATIFAYICLAGFVLLAMRLFRNREIKAAGPGLGAKLRFAFRTRRKMIAITVILWIGYVVGLWQMSLGR